MKRKPPTILPYAFLPGSPEFDRLVRGCALPEIRHKFRQLESLSPRGLRAEVGSVTRLLNGVFRSPAFAMRCRGGLDLGRLFDKLGKLIVERGDEIGEDAMRAIMGAIILLVIDFAKRRRTPWPPIRIVIDEATNARMVSAPELRALAECNKNGLYFTFLVQNLDFPGGSDAVLQNCHAHFWYGCPNYELARKGAADILAGLPPSGLSRAERLESLAHELMMLPPGWRWVRDADGSRKEYVPLLENPWPEWGSLRADKLREKLCRIFARPEYGASAAPPSSPSSTISPRPPSKSRGDSSAAARWKRKTERRGDGCKSNDDSGV